MLVLRHASKRPSGTWGPDDWDVINGSGGTVGRILKSTGGVPQDRPWQWSITGVAVYPMFPHSGFEATLDEAKVALATTWRARCERTIRKPVLQLVQQARLRPVALAAESVQGAPCRAHVASNCQQRSPTVDNTHKISRALSKREALAGDGHKCKKPA